MNFKTYYSNGQLGNNIGLTTGCSKFDQAIGGIQRKAIYGIAAAPKVGKTKFTDQHFVIEPYLYAIENDVDIEFIYLSYEMDRLTKEFDFAVYYMATRLGMPTTFIHKDIEYEISADYFTGGILDEDNEFIKCLPAHEELLFQAYDEFVIPLFGEYDNKGKRIKTGKMDFFRKRDNPTGIQKMLWKHANKNGKFVKDNYVNDDGRIQQKVSGYIPNNPDKYTIVVTDHIRKLKAEQGMYKKQVMDKYIEYQVDLRDLVNYTFVDIVHLNRSIGSPERIKMFSTVLYPTGDDVKDSG